MAALSVGAVAELHAQCRHRRIPAKCLGGAHVKGHERGGAARDETSDSDNGRTRTRDKDLQGAPSQLLCFGLCRRCRDTNLAGAVAYTISGSWAVMVDSPVPKRSAPSTATAMTR